MPEGNKEVVDAPLESEKQVVAVTPQTPASLEEALKRLAVVEAEATKNAELVEKFRKFETEHKRKAEREAEKAAIEAGEFKKLYETAQQKLQQNVVDGVLKDALTEAKVRSVSTALKLIDRSKVALNDDGSVNPDSIKQALKDLKASDPLVFETDKDNTTEAEVRTVVVPPLHRAGEGASKGGYEVEVRGAKTQRAIEEVMRKYGHIK